MKDMFETELSPLSGKILRLWRFYPSLDRLVFLKENSEIVVIPPKKAVDLKVENSYN